MPDSRQAFDDPIELAARSALLVEIAQGPKPGQQGEFGPGAAVGPMTGNRRGVSPGLFRVQIERLRRVDDRRQFFENLVLQSTQDVGLRRTP